MDAAAKEGAGGQHHGAGVETQTHIGDGADAALAVHNQVVHRLLEDGQIRLVFQHAADRGLVENAVGLRTGGTHRRAFAGVEYAELDASTVGGAGHGAAQCIDLFDQMALADATNGRVATHLAEGFDVMGQQQGRRTHTRSRQRGFGTGVTTTNDNDIETLREIHRFST